MKTRQLSIGFSRFNYAGLLVKANHILNSLTANINFPSPNPTLIVLQAAITAFYTALTDVQRFNPVTYTVLKAKRTALISTLQTLAYDIELTAAGNLEMLQTCGYTLLKQRQPVGVLPPSAITKISQGYVSGSLKVKALAIKGANAYEFAYTVVPITKESIWTNITETRSNTIIGNLPVGAQYAVRVCAVGTNPTRICSDAVTSCYVS